MLWAESNTTLSSLQAIHVIKYQLHPLESRLMEVMEYQLTGEAITCSEVCQGWQQKIYQRSALLYGEEPPVDVGFFPTEDQWYGKCFRVLA